MEKKSKTFNYKMCSLQLFPIIGAICMQNRENELYKRVLRGTAITSLACTAAHRIHFPQMTLAWFIPDNLGTETAVPERGSWKRHGYSSWGGVGVGECSVHLVALPPQCLEYLNIHDRLAGSQWIWLEPLWVLLLFSFLLEILGRVGEMPPSWFTSDFSLGMCF